MSIIKTVKCNFFSSIARNSYVYLFLCVSKSEFHVSLLRVYVCDAHMMHTYVRYIHIVAEDTRKTL